MKTFKLPDLRSGLHSETLRELAAKEMGWTQKHTSDGYYDWVWVSPAGKEANSLDPASKLPAYPTDLNTTRSLLESLTEKERVPFINIIRDVCYPEGKTLNWCDDDPLEWCWLALMVKPLEILIAYCLTKSLIKLEE